MISLPPEIERVEKDLIDRKITGSEALIDAGFRWKNEESSKICLNTTRGRAGWLQQETEVSRKSCTCDARKRRLTRG